MAVIKAVSSKASINTAINYITQKEKTESKLVSGINCMAESAADEMEVTKLAWDKTGGRTYEHFVQSYHPEDNITAEQAHQNALELAKGTKAWDGFEVLVATHIDRNHIHSHFIVNSVSFEDGHKLQMSKKDLQDIKERNDEMSREQGLHVPQRGKTYSGADREETSSFSKDTFQMLKKAEKGEVQSYVQDIALAIMDVSERAESREEFIESLKKKNIGVDWIDTHKYITFTDLARQEQGEKKCKVRNNRLEKYYNIDFSKENLEHEFESNARKATARAGEDARTILRNARSIVANTGAEREDSDTIIEKSRARAVSATAERANREAERERLAIEESRRNDEAELAARQRREQARKRNRNAR